MNIFYLDDDPFKAAGFMYDQHVVKMILETAQLLSTAHHVLGSGTSEMYKKTHVNHPSAVWVRESVNNYDWTYLHFLGLCQEYTYRYGKTHKTETKLKDVLGRTPPSIPDGPLTPIPLCMPDVHKTDCPVQSYRHYYVFGKAEHMHKWRRRGAPEWYTNISST